MKTAELNRLEKIGKGDAVAMKTFFNDYSDCVYRYVLSRRYDELLAADIVSDVMLEVWRKPQHYNGSCEVSTWLIGIARYKLLEQFRRDRRHEHDDLDESIPDPEPIGETIVAAARNADWVAKCLEKLTEFQRDILHMAFYEELSYVDMAQSMDVPVGTIKSRLFHAKESLRNCLTRITQGAIAHEYI